MIPAAKIDAATALRYLRDLPDNDVLITAAHKRTTGLTVADLRELLEAARDGGWRDASDPPADGREVMCEDHEYDPREVAGYHLPECGYWIDGEGHYLNDVRRWRELPR